MMTTSAEAKFQGCNIKNEWLKQPIKVGDEWAATAGVYCDNVVMELGQGSIEATATHKVRETSEEMARNKLAKDCSEKICQDCVIVSEPATDIKTVLP